MQQFKWDWQHTAIVVAIVAGVTSIIIAGKGDSLIAILSALGGAGTVAALLKRSPLDGAP